MRTDAVGRPMKGPGMDSDQVERGESTALTETQSPPMYAAKTTSLGEMDFDAPIWDRYFEDYRPGETYEYGVVEVTEEQILQFARAFDPQLMHLDPVAAEQGPFHGLIASGWHTGSIAMRLFVDHYVSRVASLASPGMEELRWPRPVRPGDQLVLQVHVESARLSESRPDRGVVTSRLSLRKTEGVETMSLTTINFFGTRAAGPVIARVRTPLVP